MTTKINIRGNLGRKGSMLVDMTNVGYGAETQPNYLIDNTGNPLDEITVFSPYKYNKDQLTTSNYSIVPRIDEGKALNPHLSDRALQGAYQHNAWEEDNPWQAGLSYVASTVPFAVASVPFMAEAPEILPYLSNTRLGAMMGKAIGGQTGANIGGFLGAGYDTYLAGNGVLNGINTAINGNTLYDKAKGVVEGALNILPFYQSARQAPKAMRLSFADNIVPASYVDSESVFNTSKASQVKKFVKDSFGHMAYPNNMPSDHPYSEQLWYPEQVAMNYRFHIPGMQGVTGKTVKNSRQDALNLSLGFPQKNNTYVPNGDGTYSYNPELFTQPAYVSTPWRIPGDYAMKNGYHPIDDVAGMSENGASWVGGDVITGTGGFTKLSNKNGDIYMEDLWDVQPFKDEWRLPFGAFGKIMHKVNPNFEVISFLGGKPFMLKQNLSKMRQK